MTKQISYHAAAAKMIRAELKKHGIKGRVRAKSYSGGSSINVDLTDELPATVKKVKEYAEQFQAGHFDGMTDCYEYSNSRKDIPQVSFVFINNLFSDEIRQAAWDYVRGHFGGYEDSPEDYNAAANLWINGDSVSQFVWRILNGSTKSGFWTARKPRVTA